MNSNVAVDLAMEANYARLNEEVCRLQEMCAQKKSEEPSPMKWVLIAIGISLFAISLIFIGAAFAAGSLLSGKIGMALTVPSILIAASAALLIPPDYEKASEKVDIDLVEYAEETGIDLTPDKIIFNRYILDQKKGRQVEEDAVRLHTNRYALDGKNDLS